MTDIHVTRELLKAVSRGALPSSVLARIGWEHLMSLCPCCHEEYAAWQKEEAAATRPGAYDSFQAIPHLLERQIRDQEEKNEAAMKDLDELLRLSQKDRLLKIQRSTKRFRGLTLARMLLDEAKRNVPAQSLAVQELAEVAHAILLRTSERPGINDLLARSAALPGERSASDRQAPGGRGADCLGPLDHSAKRSDGPSRVRRSGLVRRSPSQGPAPVWGG
jgi:hypothetical protein